MNEPHPPEDRHRRVGVCEQLVPDYRYTITDVTTSTVVVDVFVLDQGSTITINGTTTLRFGDEAMECWYVDNDALARISSSNALVIRGKMIEAGNDYTLAGRVSGGPGFSPLFTSSVGLHAEWSTPSEYSLGTSSWFRFDPDDGPACGLELNVVTGGGSSAIHGVQWYVKGESYQGVIGGSAFDGSTWYAAQLPTTGWVARKSL